MKKKVKEKIYKLRIGSMYIRDIYLNEKNLKNCFIRGIDLSDVREEREVMAVSEDEKEQADKILNDKLNLNVIFEEIEE